MTDQPRILVVTPTLGVSEYLDAMIAGLHALPLNIFHVISCPAPRVEELRARFPGSTVVADAGKRGGIYGALNAALAAAGDDWQWFTYINDDDELAPGFATVARQHFAQADPEAVTYGRVRQIDEHGTPIGFITTENAPRYLPALLQQGISPLNQQGMLFRADVVRSVREFDTRFTLCADLDFWLRAYARGFSFRYYPVEVGRFRLRPGQLSGAIEITRAEQDAIVARSVPQPVSPLAQRWAKLRYRLCNLPLYLARSRTQGWSSSYDFLARGGRRPA